MTNKYQEYIERKQKEYGAKFNSCDLAPQFIRYYENRQRVIVKTHYGETIRGYVGITTGWKPCFILLKNVRSIGSSETLSDKDEIVGTVNKYR